MRFKLKSSDIFPIPLNKHMLHLGTIGYSLREFMVTACVRGPQRGQVYIEEVVLNTVNWTEDVFANLKFVSDDNLANDLAKYAEMNGLTDMKKVADRLISTGRESWLIGL